MLFKGNMVYDQTMDIYIREPWVILRNKTEAELEEILSEAQVLIIIYILIIIIKQLQTRVENDKYLNYWYNFIVLVENELELINNENVAPLLDQENIQEIKLMFENKPLTELVEMEQQINETLDNKEFKVDTEYW